ncbi:ribosome biogenesis GTP-binding protein YihA/YsxC [Methylobrevis pamukkalensis]|uniref:Probable GTP-binding protein EngB n=1 Tax=Methylobrevis pamukkalensis TaxID=1439726 RepID=A0A1E3H1G3_9HYPH|nr:ribosome biogenesis GTP-binding protein YihA/YsxC [Methylobrevis pamukkalensis]ODN70163.1 putative GTP-binding protein EngB [Methylobrevis pamukkalensis]
MTDLTPPAADAPDPAFEAGRLLFARPWGFVRGIVDMGALPGATGTEIAFAGRSNVGKSSLINALTGQSVLARTSNTPGRTQELNLFRPEGGDDLLVVDMPGYGYAKAPKAHVDAWNRLVFSYLRGRPTLRRVYVLIDARHGIKTNDDDVLDLLDKAAVSYQIVLTKADKIGTADLEALEAATAEKIRKRPAAFPEVLATSSEKGRGIPELRAAIWTLTQE